MSDGLPSKKITKIKTDSSNTYDIVPQYITDGSTNYSLTAPTLTTDDTIVTLGTTQEITGTKTIKDTSLDFAKTGESTTWSIGELSGGTLQLYRNNLGKMLFASSYFQSYSHRPIANNTYDLGSSSYGWRDLYLTNLATIDYSYSDSSTATSYHSQSLLDGKSLIIKDLATSGQGATGGSVFVTGNHGGKVGISSEITETYTGNIPSDSADAIYFGFDDGSSGMIYKQVSGTSYGYSFPNTSGTIALTSDIPSTSNFVTTNTSQTISGQKTFSGAVILSNSSLRINSDNETTYTGDDWDTYYHADKIEIENQDTGNIGTLRFPDVEDNTKTLATTDLISSAEFVQDLSNTLTITFNEYNLYGKESIAIYDGTDATGTLVYSYSGEQSSGTQVLSIESGHFFINVWGLNDVSIGVNSKTGGIGSTTIRGAYGSNPSVEGVITADGSFTLYLDYDY